MFSVFWVNRSFKWRLVSRDASHVVFFIICVTASWSFLPPHYAELKLGALSVTELAGQLKVTKWGKLHTQPFLKQRIRQYITLWNIVYSSFKTEKCFVIIYTKLRVSVLNCSSCRLNMVSLFGCSSGPSCRNMCDLYMMNRVGPQFWHIVLSWESLAKRLNFPQCKNAWQSSGVSERPLSIFTAFNKQLGPTVFAWPHESYLSTHIIPLYLL